MLQLIGPIKLTVYFSLNNPFKLKMFMQVKTCLINNYIIFVYSDNQIFKHTVLKHTTIINKMFCLSNSVVYKQDELQLMCILVILVDSSNR